MSNPFELKLAKERLLQGDSLIEGLGVFANIGFRKGDLLSVLQGERISVPELKRRYDEKILRPSDPLQVSPRVYVHLYAPFIRLNHSCDPNTAIVRETDLIALRPIDQGEELTLDYSLTEWTWPKFGRHREWRMPCACGSQACRGIVSQFPYLPLPLKKARFRKGILPDFIMRKVVDAGLAYTGRENS